MVKLLCGLVIVSYMLIYIGCGLTIDPIELENSIINAQNAIDRAENLDAEKFAKERFNQAKDFLEQARQAKDTNKGVQSIDFSVSWTDAGADCWSLCSRATC